MRDHRHLVDALQARHRLVRRAVPDVRRVLVAARTPVVLVHRPQPFPDVHLALALTLAGAPDPAVHWRTRLPRPPSATIARVLTIVTRAGLPRVAAAMTTPEPDVESVYPATTDGLRHIVAVRQETRVPGVERVVSRPSASETVRTAAVRTAAVGSAEQAERAHTPWPGALRTVPSGPTPGDLATITNHVLTAIDHRLVSYRERLGRG